MISSVLSEAIERIKRYRLEFDSFPTDWPEMDGSGITDGSNASKAGE
jgi:hypothetical protein